MTNARNISSIRAALTGVAARACGIVGGRGERERSAGLHERG